MGATNRREALHIRHLWVTRWGVRHHTWEDSIAKAEHGSKAREEVFRVMHAATIATIHQESLKGSPRKANQMYEGVKTMVASLILDRHRALTSERFDATWVKTGATHLEGDRLIIDLWKTPSPPWRARS